MQNRSLWGRGVETRAVGRPPPEYYREGNCWLYTGGQHGDGREKAASEFAQKKARENDADAFLNAIDEFHLGGRQCELIHVGPKKGALLDSATRLRQPLTALEFGTQIGYSAIRIARCLPCGGKLWSIEPNPENVDLAEANIRHCGLSDKVTVLKGTFDDAWKSIPCPVDLVFLDHSRAAYLRELRGLEKWGYISIGTIVIADNIGGQAGSHGHAKAEEYASHVRSNGKYVSSFHWGDDDGIEVSEFVGTDKRLSYLTEDWDKQSHGTRSVEAAADAHADGREAPIVGHRWMRRHKQDLHDN